jgi:hypothetical protein
MASQDESGVEIRLGGRLTDHIGLGVLSARFGRDLLEEVVNDTGGGRSGAGCCPRM